MASVVFRFFFFKLPKQRSPHVDILLAVSRSRKQSHNSKFIYVFAVFEMLVEPTQFILRSFKSECCCSEHC